MSYFDLPGTKDVLTTLEPYLGEYKLVSNLRKANDDMAVTLTVYSGKDIFKIESIKYLGYQYIENSINAVVENGKFNFYTCGSIALEWGRDHFRISSLTPTFTLDFDSALNEKFRTWLYDVHKQMIEFSDKDKFKEQLRALKYI